MKQLFYLFLMLFPAFALASPLSATYKGFITSGESGVNVLTGDSVLVVFADNLDKTVGIGSISSADGEYSVTATLDSSLGSPELTMVYRQGSNVYQLTTNGTQPISLIFIGDDTPVTFTINARIGKLLFSDAPPPTGPDDLEVEDSRLDVNNDGVFNQADLDLLKNKLRGRKDPEGLSIDADIDGDNRTSTRDVIEAIKTFEKNSFEQRLKN